MYADDEDEESVTDLKDELSSSETSDNDVVSTLKTIYRQAKGSVCWTI